MRISLYKFNEAASGTSPPAVLDSDPVPVNALIDYGSAPGIFWDEVPGGRALNLNESIFGVAQATGIDSSKYSVLSGTKTITMSCVWSRTGSSTAGGRQILMQVQGVALIQMVNDSIFADVAGDHAFAWDGPVDATPVVLSLVIDTSQADSADRIKLYIDSTLQVPTFAESIPQDDTWTIGDLLRFGGEAAGFGEFCPNGQIAAAAVYTEAQDLDAVSQRSEAWLIDNDADPDAQPQNEASLFMGNPTLLF